MLQTKAPSANRTTAGRYDRDTSLRVKRLRIRAQYRYEWPSNIVQAHPIASEFLVLLARVRRARKHND
jgi:hypothetical protein